MAFFTSGIDVSSLDWFEFWLGGIDVEREFSSHLTGLARGRIYESFWRGGDASDARHGWIGRISFEGKLGRVGRGGRALHKRHGVFASYGISVLKQYVKNF